MTRKLYDLDSHRRDFSATVLRCDPDGARYAVVLDQTVFFPEGGGQPADTGVLGGARVLDVQLLPDAIVHYTDAPLAPGAQVRGQIDWPQRFRRMQDHSGEHIISGLIHKEYGFDNVGFHLGEDAITMDYSGELTWTQLMHIEQHRPRSPLPRAVRQGRMENAIIATGWRTSPRAGNSRQERQTATKKLAKIAFFCSAYFHSVRRK